LLEKLEAEPGMKGARVLYATAEDSRDVLPKGLRQMGAAVDIVPLYRSVPDRAVAATLKTAIDAGEVDLVTFASGSAVDGFVALVGEKRAEKMRGASIGPITSAAAEKYSIVIIAQAAESTMDSLVEAVVGAYWELRND
jgi:uroporphyrinogen III methyltransferase/synthase